MLPGMGTAVACFISVAPRWGAYAATLGRGSRTLPLTASCMRIRYFFAASTPWVSLTELWHAMERSCGWDARGQPTSPASDRYSAVRTRLMNHIVNSAVRAAPDRPAIAVAVAQVFRLMVYMHRRGVSVCKLKPNWATTLLAPYVYASHGREAWCFLLLTFGAWSRGVVTGGLVCHQ